MKRTRENQGKTPVPISKQPHGLAHEELVIEVCRLFCLGRSPSDIAMEMNSQYGLTMTREQPYKLLQYAASSGLLRVVAPREDYLSKKFDQKFRWLSETVVVHTLRVEDVAEKAAEMLVRLLQERHRQKLSKTMHIGFPGGYAMWKVLEKFAELLLKEPMESLPEEVVFHHLVSGLDSELHQLNVGPFFLQFQSEEGTQIRIRVRRCTAPSVIESELIERILKQPLIEEAYNEVKVGKLDIILTSGSDFEDDDSIFREGYFNKDYLNRKELINAGCVGDMLWYPLSVNGPIKLDPHIYEYRTLALVDLHDLPSHIQSENHTHVLLVLGPCGGCGKLKTRILDTILNLPKQYITHLVVDSRTARGLFEP